MATTNPRDFLTEYQQQLLGSFQEVVQIEDDQLCVDLLQQNGWNLENAVNAFMLGGTSSPSPSTRRVPPTRLQAPNPSNERSTNRLLPAVDDTEYPVNTRSVDTQINEEGNEDNAPNNNDTAGGGTGGNGFLDLILTPIRWLFSSRTLALNPNRDADNFIQEYTALYGPSLPSFHRGSYQSAVALAFQQSKFLLVYLHSPLHEDNDSFCRDVLSHSSFINYCNDTAIVWGGSVWNAEAYGLSSQLGVTSYPFLGLLVCQSVRTVQVADRIQGILELDPLLTRLRNVTAVYSSIVERNRLEAERRAESIRLREQQDREYQESIEAERQEIERQRAEEEEKARLEEEKKQQEELAAAIEFSKQITKENELRKLKAAFEESPEPELGPDIATLRFQLPRGKKLTYRFHKNDKAKRIQDYLRLQFFNEGDLTSNFVMSTTYPKMEINDFEKTIEELGLHPRAMVYVQDCDA